MWTQPELNNEFDKTAADSMNTLSALVNKVVKQGYTDSFTVTKKGLYSNSMDKYYTPNEVNVVNFYRFEGQSDPSDNAIMYVIETPDEQKGTLIDAYGTYSDGSVSKFMQEVEEISKLNKRSEGPSE
jgi:hypothetical protein